MPFRLPQSRTTLNMEICAADPLLTPFTTITRTTSVRAYFRKQREHGLTALSRIRVVKMKLSAPKVPFQ